ncbi:hypothetical protein ASU31_12670 [Pedobacter ginsenosidimutans]|uniref:Glycosyltransferase 2-like domain-containing protein n=1 Tax=Pedobacter ginsenosidimutans TaxID=687842 RepID=A0A0T5VPU0_9SPHI|nr:glycosyltransferase family 2 protein [Pedobacter ginsenosidimutans]KRT15832.1 hypothetical protein ASU31_12670 [Pedobacter ginsenosidimutans]
MNLPSLEKYTSNFILRGINVPLKRIKNNPKGLLKELPEVDNLKTGWPWDDQVNPEIYSYKKQWPKLTIVTPSFNQGQYIEETIRSVLLQNYPNLEYIIIDGCSTDNTKEILEKYSPWISYWQSEKDNGQSNAINLGFSLATGNYYGWINSDDYYLKNVFHLVSESFLKSKSNFIYGYGYSYDENLNQYNLIKTAPFFDLLIRIPSLLQPSCFWSSSIHQPTWEELSCALDYELWLRLVKGNKRRLIKEPLAVARIHEQAKSYNLSFEKKWEKDHLLICGNDAHGSVPTWKYLIFLNRIYRRILLLINY